MNPQRLIHDIAPVYDAHSRVLLLGTFPSPKSRETGFYYGHPQNRFWTVIAHVLGETPPQTVAQKKSLLLRHGIALWDVLCACEITGARDDSIREAKPNDLKPIFQTADIQAVFTTGQKAFQLYKKYLQPVWIRPALVLPSTSPANCACGMERLVEAYGQIAAYLA